MTSTKFVHLVDRWGTVLLIYALPWQARLIFQQGFLVGVPAEAQTKSIFVLELAIVALLLFRLARMTIDRERLVAHQKTFIAFGCLTVLALVSMLVAVDRAAALFGFVQLAFGGTLLFLIVTAPSEREVRIAFVISMCVQSAIAVSQLILQQVFPSTLFGMAVQHPEVAGTSVVEAGGLRLLRAYGTLPHPNILGGAIAIAILQLKRLDLRPLYTIAFATLLSVGLFLSFSRLAWLALAVGLTIQTFFPSQKVDGRIKYASAATVAAVFVLLAAVFAPFFIARIGASGRLETKSLTTRASTLKDATALVKLFPLTGTGIGNFPAAVFKYVDSSRSGYALEPAHSMPVLVLAELGIFGLALFLLLIYYASKDALASGNLGLVVALCILAAFDHWAWTTLGGILIFWAGWGMATRKS